MMADPEATIPSLETNIGPTNLTELLINQSLVVTRVGKFNPKDSGYTQGIATTEKGFRDIKAQESGRTWIFGPETIDDHYKLFKEAGINISSGYIRGNTPLVILGPCQIGYKDSERVPAVTFIETQKELNPIEGNRSGLLAITTNFIINPEKYNLIREIFLAETPNTNQFVEAYNHFFPNSHPCGQYQERNLPVTIVEINDGKGKLLSPNFIVTK